MFLSFVRKELLANILSLRYSLIFFLSVVLAMSATAIRTAHYEKQVVDAAEAKRDWYTAMLSADRFWQSRGLGVSVEKQPNPLAIFAYGLENEVTRAFSLSEWTVPRTGERKLSNPSFRYFMNLDMVVIVNMVCSLLAMLLVFDAVCGEREQGTLKVLLAGPLPRDTVIIGKLVAGIVTLLAPFVIAWAGSLVYVLVIRKVGLDGDQMARLAWIVALSLLYVTFFFAAGLAVSCWTQRSATALAVCLFFWIVFVLALPNLVPMVVNHFAPIPPESKITLEKQVAYQTFEKEEQPKIYGELSASGKYDGKENDLWRELQRRREEYVSKENEKIDRFYNSRIGRQLRLNQEISRLSPSAAFVYASTHLAGTGVRDFLRIIDEVDAYQRDYETVQKEQEEARQKRDEQTKRKWFDEVKDAYDPSVWPAFSPKPIALGAVMDVCWVDIVLLAGGSVVFLLLAVVGFMRYDPR